MFKDEDKNENEKMRLEAVDKIKNWCNMKLLPEDYAKDLLTIIKNDALTGEEIRFINKQTKATVDKISEKISHEYVDRITKKMKSVNGGSETLIISEQFIQ